MKKLSARGCCICSQLIKNRVIISKRCLKRFKH